MKRIKPIYINTIKMQYIRRMTQGQEVEFHEIEIQLFHEVEFLIMKSKLTFFMRSNFFAKLIRRLLLINEMF
jgi:hypothetical protein